ncbi:MAG: hypothetical protein KJ915_09170 [Candidatus Omnitrophica bacterium]|nr:hypothetical protein [Candidatus Omnitrophota bacterium]
MSELNTLISAFEHTLKDSNLQNITIDLAEVFTDTLMEESIAREIPIIGTVVGLGKTALGIKEFLFLKKIIYFISELKNISATKRYEMIDKIDNSGKFRTKVGEKLLYIIDKCDDHEKSQFIARMFAAFLCQKISYEDFLRSASIIDRTLLEDLIWVIGHDDFMYEELGDLVNSGMFNVNVVDQRDYDLKLPAAYKLEAHLSEIGNKIKDILTISIENNV